MTIYAKRIPSGLDGLGSLGGCGFGSLGACGPDQQFDPNLTFAGVKGQCIPKTQALSPAPAPGFFDSFMSAMFTKPAAPAAPVAPTAMAPVSQGMSQNTMIALGLGAVGLVALVLIATRK